MLNSAKIDLSEINPQADFFGFGDEWQDIPLADMA
jgi:hypothetical protein